MSASLIIDARHRLRWHERLVSEVSTALLWSGWLWLWAPLLRAYDSIADVGARLTPAFSQLLEVGPEIALGNSFVALIGASGTLIVCTHLPRRACASPPLSLRDHAEHFHLSERELREARQAAVCVVHHDEHGRIVRLERREPTGQVEHRAA